MSLSDRFTFWTGGLQNVGSFQKTASPCSLGYAAASCAFSPLSNLFLCLGQFLKALISQQLRLAKASATLEVIPIPHGHHSGQLLLLLSLSDLVDA